MLRLVKFITAIAVMLPHGGVCFFLTNAMIDCIQLSMTMFRGLTAYEIHRHGGRSTAVMLWGVVSG